MINGLPARLREMRERSSLSQREVARRINVSASLISGYETGERTPSLEVLLSLSALYGCSTDYLLGIKALSSADDSIFSGLSAAQIHLLRAVANEFKNGKV